MTAADEVQINKLCEKLIAAAKMLKQQSDGLAGTALYLDKLSNEMENLSKSVQNILKCPENVGDLPLEFL